MDERGNTTKQTYSYEKQRSTLAYVLFALMFIIGGGGITLFYNKGRGGPSAAATFTPFLSSPKAGFGGKCTIVPDAEDFASCSTSWEKVADSQVMRCPSGYGNIEIQKVRDGETGHKNYRDMALLRSFCKGMDNCKVTLGELRAADDGMPLDNEPPMEEELEPEVDPELFIDDVAGIDSNGHVLMKSHGHHDHHHARQVKIQYECEKLEESPFEALAGFFEDMMTGETEEGIATEEIATEEIGTEETPVIFLSKRHGGCKGGLKNIAQDWDAGTVCGTASEELTLSCDPNRTGARIFVLAVKPKIKHQKPTNGDPGTDPVIEDPNSTVETEPFLAKRGHHGHERKHKKGKQLGWQLTDICAGQPECKTTLNVDLQAALAENPLVNESTPMHVKYMCSYDHETN